MKYKITKLKRYKILCNIVSVIFLPFTVPLWLLIKLGEISEKLHDIITKYGWKLIYKIVDIFKFEEVAERQYLLNVKKFKER